jgi:hypothetical protein
MPFYSKLEGSFNTVARILQIEGIQTLSGSATLHIGELYKHLSLNHYGRLTMKDSRSLIKICIFLMVPSFM